MKRLRQLDESVFLFCVDFRLKIKNVLIRENDRNKKENRLP